MAEKCPYCSTKVKSTDQQVNCPNCGETYHYTCWKHFTENCVECGFENEDYKEAKRKIEERKMEESKSQQEQSQKEHCSQATQHSGNDQRQHTVLTRPADHRIEHIGDHAKGAQGNGANDDGELKQLLFEREIHFGKRVSREAGHDQTDHQRDQGHPERIEKAQKQTGNAHQIGIAVVLKNGNIGIQTHIFRPPDEIYAAGQFFRGDQGSD